MFLVVSGFVLYLFLLGRAVTPFLPRDGDPFQRLALRVSLGILANFSLILCGLTIGWAIAAGVAIGVVGLAFSVGLERRWARGGVRQRVSVLIAFGALALLTGFYFLVFAEPISRWDARSVWFFHAKMIWVAQALRLSTGFDDPTIAFSSPAYPHLVPALAAELAYVKGLWNEFVPKAALLVMLVPATAWIVSLRDGSLGFAMVALMFLAFDGWLSNGYMDAYVILYSGFTLLFAGRCLASRHANAGRDVDLYSAVVAAGVAMNVKNEGMLFALCFGAALLCSRPGRALCLQTVKRLTTDRQLLAALVVALMPTALWTIEKNLWGLKSELTGDSVAAGGRLMSRLLDGSTPQFVFRYLIVEAPAVWIPLLLAVATVMFLRWRNVKPHAGAVLAITTAALYFVGIYAAYLSTPISLEFHLGTSATRTMAGLRMALMIALYFMFDDLERVPASARRRDVALAQ